MTEKPKPFSDDELQRWSDRNLFVQPTELRLLSTIRARDERIAEQEKRIDELEQYAVENEGYGVQLKVAEKKIAELEGIRKTLHATCDEYESRISALSEVVEAARALQKAATGYVIMHIDVRSAHTALDEALAKFDAREAGR